MLSEAKHLGDTRVLPLLKVKIQHLRTYILCKKSC